MADAPILDTGYEAPPKEGDLPVNATTTENGTAPEGVQPGTEAQTPPQPDLEAEELRQRYEQNPGLQRIDEVAKTGIVNEYAERTNLPDDKVNALKKRFADKSPQQLSEYIAKQHFLQELQIEHNLTDNEVAEFEAFFEGRSIEEVAQYCAGLIPDFVVGETDFGVMQPEKKASSGDGATDAENADDDENTDENAPKAPPNPDEAVEAEENQSAQEKEKSGATPAEQIHRQKAWAAFLETQKNHPDVAKQLAIRYPDLNFYDPQAMQEWAGRHPEEWQQIQAEFEDFFNNFYLPKLNPGEVAGQNDSLFGQLKQLGFDAATYSWQKSDITTLMQTILLSNSYRSGNAEIFSSSPELDKGTAIDINRFKEMANWSGSGEKKGDNRRKWMLMCALIARQLKGTSLEEMNPVEWTDEKELTDTQIKEHMQELYEASAVAGKAVINDAIKNAFDAKNGNAELTKPSFVDDCHVSADLMAHLQMMGNHIDFVENFFR
jgi:hypothetical protein